MLIRKMKWEMDYMNNFVGLKEHVSQFLTLSILFANLKKSYSALHKS